MLLPIYTVAVWLYAAGIRISARWNAKARLWIRGRKDVFPNLQAALLNNTRPVVWMHSASLGEFEQGRSLLEAIRRDHPGHLIVVSFFSPSGYEVMKNYHGADHIFYLPVPNRKNARILVGLLKPQLVLWVKYDYWYHYLHELKKRRIPILLISAIFHRRQPFFRWYGGLYRRMLRCFQWIFVQTPESEKRLNDIGFTGNISVTGDTRFDRVMEIAAHFVPIPDVERFTAGHPVIVAGSTWREDEEQLDHFANTHPGLRFIIAPHEIHEEHLKDIEKLFRKTIRYSALASSPHDGANTLIIDNIGMLSRLYHYATVAYVGGGFGSDGVHNVLEAAVYGKPVVFGPVFNKFREAIDLLEEGAAFTADNALELENILNRLLEQDETYRQACQAARRYVYDQQGATGRIMGYIQANRLLIN